MNEKLQLTDWLKIQYAEYKNRVFSIDNQNKISDRDWKERASCISMQTNIDRWLNELDPVRVTSAGEVINITEGEIFKNGEWNA